MGNKKQFSSNTEFADLLPDTLDGPQGVRMLPLASVASNRFQFRQHIAPESIQELAADIDQNGLIHPPLVRTMPDGTYQIVAGERRFRALQLLGRTEMPATVRELNDYDAALIMAAENFQRSDLSLTDELHTYERLSKDPATGEILPDRELGRRINRDYNRISRVRRLGRYPELLTDVQDGLITMTTALERISEDEGRLKLRADAGLPPTNKEEMLANRAAAGMDPNVDDDGYTTDEQGTVQRTTDAVTNMQREAEASLFSADSVARAKATTATPVSGWTALTKALNLINGLWDSEDSVDPSQLDDVARRHFIQACATAQQQLGTVIATLKQED